MNVTEKVRALVQPILDGLGLELFDLTYSQAGQGLLRIFIDKEEGVTLDDCTQVSRELETLLDVKEVVPGSYRLEVSSPGINRPMRHEADYRKYSGRRIKVKLVRKISDRKTFVGVNRGVSGGILQLEVSPEQMVEIPLQEVVRASLEVDF
ncbi:MAG: ribosome maturation factor RimP [Deltaproteobacteria bacterium]|nr:ribosome maturation factor RimP [Deltaproteobacteria bacterium]